MQGGLPGADAIMDDRTSVLKLVLATTLILEGKGKDSAGREALRKCAQGSGK